MLLLLAFALQQPSISQKQLVEELRISASGDAELQSVGSVVELGGRIYVTDPRGATVLRFSAAGRAEGAVGRSGEGPGEYRNPRTIGVRGDSLWIGDPQQRRIVIYDGAGGSGRTITLLPNGYGTLSLLADGSPILIPTWGSERARPGAPPNLPVVRFDATGEVRDTLFQVAVELRQMQMDVGGGSFLIGAQRFGDSPLVVASPTGNGLLVVERRTTGPAQITLVRYDARGRSSWRSAIGYTPEAMDQSVVDSVVGAFVHPVIPGAPAVAEELVRKTLWIPPRMVPVLNADLAPDGKIWLRRPVPVGSGAKYTVTSPEGRPEFEVLLPKGAKLSGFGAGTVWLTLLDEDDLPTLVRYRVR